MNEMLPIAVLLRLKGAYHFRKIITNSKAIERVSVPLRMANVQNWDVPRLKGEFL